MNPEYPVAVPVENLRPGLTTWRVKSTRFGSFFVKDEYLERRFDLSLAYPHIAFKNGGRNVVYLYGATEYATIGNSKATKIPVRRNDLRAMYSADPEG